VVGDARVLPGVPAEMMVEMAFSGARVLHARAAELAAAHEVCLRVRSSLADGEGTTVPLRADAASLEGHGVTAVTHDLDAVRVLVRSDGPRHDLAAELLTVLAELNAPLDMVARSGPFEDEFRMGFTMRRSDLDRVISPLRSRAERVGGMVILDSNVAKVSLVGIGLLSRPQYTARLLRALADAGIATSWLFTSQLRTSVTVPLERGLDAVALLYEEFALDPDASTAYA
jgi:aspartate kinase